jgi:hypothetical protein
MHEPTRSPCNRQIGFALLCALLGVVVTIGQARSEAWSARGPADWPVRVRGSTQESGYWQGWSYLARFDSEGRLVSFGDFAGQAHGGEWDPSPSWLQSMEQRARRPPSWSRPAARRPDGTRAIDRVSAIDLVFGWPFRALSSRFAYRGQHSPEVPAVQFVVDGVHIEDPPMPESDDIFNFHPHLLRWPWITANDSVPREMLVGYSREPLANGIRPCWAGQLDFALPTRVMLPGFLANSLIYAALLFSTPWVLRGSAASVRFAFRNTASARARRGACRACGHQLAGLARCPECGRS